VEALFKEKDRYLDVPFLVQVNIIIETGLKLPLAL